MPSDQNDLIPPPFQTVAKGGLSAPWDQLNFAIGLFRQMKHEALGRNVFISPVALALSLLLLHSGAKGATRKEIERVLGAENLDYHKSGDAATTLMNELCTSGDLELGLGNSIWLRNDLDVVPEFETNARALLEAEVERMDLASDRTLDRMNAWVSEKTRGKIPRIGGRIAPTTWMQILNAVYFKGAWLGPFDPKNTKPEAFTRSDGTQKTVSMMFKESWFNSLQGAGFQGVSLPYSGNRFHMLVIIPDGSLDAFIDHLNPKDWVDVRARFRGMRRVKMPRFKLECEAPVKKALANLGLHSASSPDKADFSGIVRQPATAHLDEIRHKAMCEVDERGTVAAAFADLKLLCGATGLTLNRPFLFFIEEIQTKFILFLGAVEDP